MARPRKQYRAWQTSMRYELTCRFDKAPVVHTLLYMSGPDAQDIMIEALSRYAEETNHPAMDPRVQGAVTMKALGLDPALGLRIDSVLKDIPKFKRPVRSPVARTYPVGEAETPLAPAVASDPVAPLSDPAPEDFPVSVTHDEPAVPVIESGPSEENSQTTPSSSLATRWLQQG
jgi:hypothetical protein